MKKIISLIGFAVIAMAMFFNTNQITNGNDIDLASLMKLEKACAECEFPESGGDKFIDLDPCTTSSGEEGNTKECHNWPCESCIPSTHCTVWY